MAAPENCEPLFVLRNQSARDVADAIMQNGKQQEPFYIFDLDEVYRNVCVFKEKLPNVDIFYALKSNDYSMLAKLAIALGLGFDCASPGEITKIKELNVNPRSIIYAMPMKSPDQIVFAKESGVRHTTFDSHCELKKLKQYWPDAKLLLRIRVESDSVYKLGDKFGCEFSEAVELLEKAARLGLSVVGIAFHVGSGCFSSQSYMTGILQARALFDHELKEGRRLSILDIGGGFFKDNTNRFDEVADIINKGLRELFSDPDIQVIAEPGRYICESAFTLYNNINNVKTVYSSNKPINIIYTNNAINGVLWWLESWHTSHKYKKNSIQDTKYTEQETIIWGPTPDDKDRLKTVKFESCSHQDWLVFNQAGAYGKTFTSTFCGFQPPPIRCVVSQQLWELLKTSPVFASEEYLLEMDSSSPLPSTLPPLPQKIERFHDTATLDD